MHKYIHIRTCIYIHIYIHMHTHTHPHTHTHIHTHMYYFQVYNTISRHGRRKGGGGKNRSSPSPLENKNFFFCHIGDIFPIFSLHGAFLLRFSHYGGPFSQCGSLFAFFYSMMGAFWAPPPPSAYKNFCGRPCLK